MDYFEVLRQFVLLLPGCGMDKEMLEYRELLILLECCTINICAADISWKVISLQIKGYTST
jgi:hypothetical protein